MADCTSCEAHLTDSDRFCPACGHPNPGAKFHPRFGPATERPSPLPPPRVAPVGVPACPRCLAEVAVPAHFCGACGMPLDGLRETLDVERFGGVWFTPGPSGKRRYRSLLGRARVARAVSVALCGASALLVVALVVATLSRPLLGDDGGGTAGDVVTDGRFHLVVVGLLALAAVSFLAWVTRAYGNLESLGVRGQRAGRAWALLAWFVPLVNLVVPKEVVDDLYRGSHPEAPIGSSAWRLAPVPSRVHLWWLSVIGFAVSLPLTAVLAAGGWRQLEPVALVAMTVTYAALAAAAGLSAWLVAEITDRQVRRVARLGTRPTRRPAPAPRPAVDAADGAVDPGLVHRAEVLWGRY